jgi:hypothetical protein
VAHKLPGKLYLRLLNEFPVHHHMPVMIYLRFQGLRNCRVLMPELAYGNAGYQIEVSVVLCIVNVMTGCLLDIQHQGLIAGLSNVP